VPLIITDEKNGHLAESFRYSLLPPDYPAESVSMSFRENGQEVLLAETAGRGGGLVTLAPGAAFLDPLAPHEAVLTANRRFQWFPEGSAPKRMAMEFQPQPFPVVRVTRTFDPPELRPTGSEAPSEPSVSRVTVTTEPPYPGLTAAVSVRRHPGSGGHGTNHPDSPVSKGTFTLAGGAFTASGFFQADFRSDFHASRFGGLEIVTLEVGGRKFETFVDVRVPGLVRLEDTPNIYLIHAGAHPENLWGEAGVVAVIPQMAAQVIAEVPEISRLGINDMSLEQGGGFDVGADWVTGPPQGHVQHRRGRNCDVRIFDIPVHLRPRVRAILEEYAGVDLHNPGTRPHWHLRFGPGPY
jgi:hypothetical protein